MKQLSNKNGHFIANHFIATPLASTHSKELKDFVETHFYSPAHIETKHLFQ